MDACNAGSKQLLHLNCHSSSSFIRCDVSDTTIATNHLNCCTVSCCPRIHDSSTLLNLTATPTHPSRCLSARCNHRRVHRAHLRNCTYSQYYMPNRPNYTRDFIVLYSTVTRDLHQTMHACNATQTAYQEHTHMIKTCRSLPDAPVMSTVLSLPFPYFI